MVTFSMVVFGLVSAYGWGVNMVEAMVEGAQNYAHQVSAYGWGVDMMEVFVGAQN
jgi:hypothetical protein